MKAAILTIGSELTTGQIADTNAQWIAAELTRRGIEVVWIVSVDDDPGAIRSAFAAARALAPLVWVTGGLGPTADDLTVEAVAGALGRELVEDPDAVERMRAAYAKRGATLTPYARRMALVPAGAEALPNPVGAAPGIWLEEGGTTVVVLPGVPGEMKAIAASSILPRVGARGRPQAGQVYRVTGMTEGAVDERVRDVWRGLVPGERFALQLAAGEVLLRVIVPGADRAAAERRLGELDGAIRQRLGAAVWATGEERLEERVIARLRESGGTLAVAESVTGGLVAERLTGVPGASAVVAGGWVAYQETAKTGWLGLEPARLAADGAVSAATAVAMAAAARARAGTRYGLSTTGWAGPDGGTEADPVGTVYLGTAGPDGATADRRWFRGGRETVRSLAASAALDMIRRMIG